jgi:superfamily II RNA helicase
MSVKTYASDEAMSVFTQYQISEYIWNVNRMGILSVEIDRIVACLVDAENDRKKDHVFQVKQFTQILRALLTEKARQETVNQVSNDNRSRTQDTSASPADNTSTGIRIRNILEQKIAGR